MSFLGNVEKGRNYHPGYFLAHEECERKTRQFAQANATTAANGSKYIPMGSFYPANDSSTVEGIVYEDVDVTTGDMPGSVVLSGVVYLDRLPVAPASGVQAALEAKGFMFKTKAPDVTRPGWTPIPLIALGVASVAGTASGDTKISVTGYTLDSSDGYVYKVADTETAVIYGDDLTAWTAWNGTADITAASGKVITVAVVDTNKKALAAGYATVVAAA